MSGRSKILDVDYYSQPTDTTCQSASLKMMASFLEKTYGNSSRSAAQLNPEEIKKTINGDPNRPEKGYANAHSNMLWWLSSRFPSLKFKEIITKDEIQAIQRIVKAIDNDSPVMVGVSHSRVPGHIILIVGYVNYVPNASTPDFGIVVHDPYGKFDPSLGSNKFGSSRWEGGASMMSGGERGPGKALIQDLSTVTRRRAGDDYKGHFFLMSLDV